MNQSQNNPLAPLAAAPATAATMLVPNNGNNGTVPAHLMGLMSNPALATAVAGSAHLFPPVAMLSNPGAFLTMPESFACAAQVNQAAANSVRAQQMSAPGGMVLPRLAAQQQQPQQEQQQQRQHHAPAASSMASLSGQFNFSDENSQTENDNTARRSDLTPEERAKQNRDRNREHARSTRLRKKAYVQKLKELVEGLHQERTEEVRQRRVAIQHLAEMQNVRRGVVRSFLRFHSEFETDPRKWETLLEDSFWLKQPVTPYRSFRRTEIEQDCRMSRGVQGMIADAASVAVMVEGIGSRSTRWMQLKREAFFAFEESKRGPRRLPHSISQSRMQAGVSSLSSSSGSSNGSSDGSNNINNKATASDGIPTNTNKVSQGSTGSSSDSRHKQVAATSKDFHDYNAQPLPDPKLGDSGSSNGSDDSPEESSGSTSGDNNNAAAASGKRVCTDSSSGEDSAAIIAASGDTKRRKIDSGSDDASNKGSSNANLPPNIAKTGGITANVMGLNRAPAVPLPPFAGLGAKRATLPSAAGGSQLGGGNPLNNPTGSSLGQSGNDTETSSSSSSQQQPQIRASYHMNEDDMILMEDVLMCPYVFRSQDAVVCGALAECVMPGMFRAHFSARNKLLSVEMVYDAMGFMQQLERASGSERTAQIIPGSLEMALSPSRTEARVITLAEPPFLIVNVNECWTRLTKYTQMEVEGRGLQALLEGEKTLPEASERSGKPRHMFDDVAKGLCASSTNIHYRKNGEEFVDYVCSFPLTNSNDEITHLLHTSRELPALPASIADQ